MKGDVLFNTKITVIIAAPSGEKVGNRGESTIVSPIEVEL